MFALIYLSISLAPYIFIEKVTTKDLDKLDLDGYDKLMIVAHPDDEIIWGGCHLIEDDYFVVSVTCGNRITRRREFEKVLEQTGDKGMILSYPDKIMGFRSDWTYCNEDIEKDLETIISYKDWDVIVTHNENGEYGHKQHKMLHKITNSACENTHNEDVQQYFGRYYRKRKMPDNLEPASEESIEKKEEIAKTYVSQGDTVEMFRHMFPYEMWTER